MDNNTALDFTVPPRVTNIEAEIPTTGGWVTIYGSNFGTNETDLAFSLGSRDCVNVSFVVVNETIQCYLLAGIGRISYVEWWMYLSNLFYFIYFCA